MWNFQNLCCFAYQLDFTLSSQINSYNLILTLQDFSNFGYQEFSIFEIYIGKFCGPRIRKFQFSVYREILWTKYVEFSKFLSFAYQLELRLSSQIHHQQSKLRIEKFLKIFPKSKSPKVLGKFNFSNLYREILIPRMCKIQIFKFSFCNFYPL